MNQDLLDMFNDDYEGIKEAINEYENKLDIQLKTQGHENKDDYDILMRLYGKKEYILEKIGELTEE